MLPDCKSLIKEVDGNADIVYDGGGSGPGRSRGGNVWDDDDQWSGGGLAPSDTE